MRSFVLALVLSSSALAGHLVPYPLGARETLIANTGVVGPADSTGLFYNPARLAALPEGDLNLQGSVYGLEYSDSQFTPTTRNTYTRTAAIPQSIFGSRRIFSIPVTFGIVNPAAFDRHQQIISQDTVEETSFAYSFKTQDLWLGLGTGFRLGEKLSVGITGFLIRHGQDTLSVIGTKKNDLTAGSSTYSFERRSVNVVALNLGAQYQLSSEWSLGARLQSPTVRLQGKSEIDRRTYSFVQGAAPSFSQNPDKETDATYKLPVLGVVGARYERGAVAISGSVGYFPQIATDEGGEPAGAQVSAGVEWRLSPELMLAGGLGLPYLSDQVIVAKTFAVTAGVERTFERFTARTGIFYSSYQFASYDASYRLFGISISGAYRL